MFPVEYPDTIVEVLMMQFWALDDERLVLACFVGTVLSHRLYDPIVQYPRIVYLSSTALLLTSIP
jgi:hypothetical protein